MPSKDTNKTVLSEDEKQKLKEYYKELKHYNSLRQKDPKYWGQYYNVLKRIKYLLRYGE